MSPGTRGPERRPGDGNVITVTPMGPGQFGVQVREGDVTTSHEVTIPESMIDEWNLVDVDYEHLVRESFLFLLEREPASSILPEFPLTTISRYFPEYREELTARLS